MGKNLVPGRWRLSSVRFLPTLSAKLMIFTNNLGKKGLKYALAFLTAAVFLQVVLGAWSPREAAGRGRGIDREPSLPLWDDTVRRGATNTKQAFRQGAVSASETIEGNPVARQALINSQRPVNTIAPPANNLQGPMLDSFPSRSTARPTPPEEKIPDSLRRDTLPIKNFLDKKISGKNKDL